MAKTDSETAPTTATIELEYDGQTWTHTVRQPTPGQIQQMLGLIDAKGISELQTRTEEQQQAALRRAFRSIRLARSLSEGLHVEVEEYDRMCNAIARGAADDTLTYQSIIKTLLAFNEEPEPANRAERRARAKRTA